MLFILTRTVEMFHRTNSVVFISLLNMPPPTNSLYLRLTEEEGGTERKRDCAITLSFPEHRGFAAGLLEEVTAEDSRSNYRQENCRIIPFR